MMTTAKPPASTATLPRAGDGGGFRVRLPTFEGPFDLLLGLIAKHQLDVTQLSLSTVTDDFIAHIRAQGPEWDLGLATEFLVVAATLLDLKAARLLPRGEVEDEEDLALLEARDLLFARLLQYRAYKQAASLLGVLLGEQSRRHPREVGLEAPFDALLPDVVLGVTPEQFAEIASRALAPRPVPIVAIDHVHAPAVNVQEQASLLRRRLRRLGTATFASLTADCETTLVVVGRFLALLEMYRDGDVTFDQPTALGDLSVRWTGPDTDRPGDGEDGSAGDLADATTRDPDD